MRKMNENTVDEILANWDGDREYDDWYAVDSYDVDTGTVRRLYVGDGETACKAAARFASGADLVDYEGNPAEPGEFGSYPFYRATLIDARAAHDYMLCVDAGFAASELVTMTQAARELGMTRQGVHDLIKRGKLHAERFGKEYRIGRYSIVLRKGR